MAALNTDMEKEALLKATKALRDSLQGFGLLDKPPSTWPVDHAKASVGAAIKAFDEEMLARSNVGEIPF